MTMTYIELVEQATEGLRSHGLRATLSLAGIVVGIGTVVASLAIGEGARRAAMDDIGALGIDNVFVRAVASDAGTTSSAKPRALAPELTRADAALIRARVGDVNAVAVSRAASVEVAAGPRTATATVAGVSTEWTRLTGIGCATGRCLVADDEREARRVAVLGSAIADRVARGRSPVGLAVTIDGDIFEVVGVLQAVSRRGTSALQTFDPDEAVLVPSTAMDIRLGEGDAMDRVSEIGIHVAPGADVNIVTAAIQVLLKRQHPDVGRYVLVVPRALVAARLRAERTFDAVLLATGCIALVIAGVGIMNVMLASVTERRQEIGVRMAVGARAGDVVSQFALEAALLCLGGGLIGVPIGVIFSWSVSFLAGWPTAISSSGIALALVLAVGVGLGFGIYPAYLAASTDPIDALRA
jgi:putative ABC transport system permease protein